MTNDTRQTPLIPHGERYLSIARVCDKFSRKKSWLYHAVANDPTFPKPLRIGSWQVFPESQLDAWVLQNTANVPPLDSGKRLARLTAERKAAKKVAA